MDVYHSFEKMKPQQCFFLKKPSLVVLVYFSEKYNVITFISEIQLFCTTML